MTRKGRLTVDEYEAGLRAHDRAVLARAITLIESRDEADGKLAQELLTRVLPLTGKARRIGITGVPGVGKSTFIDSLGTKLTGEGHQVAVLAVDPSSSVSGGSILGDKTRMARLAVDPSAFIRPSPSALTPGGVARRTRETLLLCESAGFDVVLVETVGVGQGETTVAEMVDTFLVMLLPGSGDELQGIKKGILELADVIAVNKADGDGADRARLALADLKSALRYLPQRNAQWKTRTVALSGLTGEGLNELWNELEAHRAFLETSGELSRQRANQQLAWFWSLIRERLEHDLRSNPKLSAQLPVLERAVLDGTASSAAAVAQLFDAP